MRVEGLRVAVVGGSLVGLTTALLLRDLGCDVDVFERSRSVLEGRGVGIVLHPMTLKYLLENGDLEPSRVSTTTPWHRYVARDGTFEAEVRRPHYFTSYDTLYRALLDRFGTSHYHLGREIVEFSQDTSRVEFADSEGKTRTCDLLVAADGVSSLSRRRLLPEVLPHYAGYVAWRAAAAESRLTSAAREHLDNSLTYFVHPSGHALVYPIPDYDGCVEPGRRLMNLVWYCNVPDGAALRQLLTDRHGVERTVSLPPGAVRASVVDELRAVAAEELPTAFAEIMNVAPEPFVQVIFDVEVPQMAFGRICLVGDAAFSVRPHAAAATAKGADDGWALADAIRQSRGDVAQALLRWEPDRLRVGRALLGRNRDLGDGAQFRNDWRPGDPSLAFGLRVPGDSSEI